jgi:hypothetical protein
VAALKQARVVLRFKLPDLESDRRLSHEQGVSSPGKAEMLGYGMKNLQAPIGHENTPESRSLLFNHIHHPKALRHWFSCQFSGRPKRQEKMNRPCAKSSEEYNFRDINLDQSHNKQ